MKQGFRDMSRLQSRYLRWSDAGKELTLVPVSKSRTSLVALQRKAGGWLSWSWRRDRAALAALSELYSRQLGD